MKKLLTAALCAASMMLASCETMPTVSTEQAAQIGSAIDRAQTAYDRIAAARAPSNVAGGTRSTGGSICSNGSGTACGVEAG
jgi:starvation-inducible outer membrane lipoprotein